VELKDLRLPKKTKEELKKDNAPMMEQEKYPYGMRLSFNTEMIPKFPELENVKSGEKVSISGIGEVMEVRKMDRQGDKNQFSVEIQIQKLGVESDSPKKDETLIGAIEKGKKGLLK
jgi:hypothetical protein